MLKHPHRQHRKVVDFLDNLLPDAATVNYRCKQTNRHTDTQTQTAVTNCGAGGKPQSSALIVL